MRQHYYTLSGWSYPIHCHMVVSLPGLHPCGCCLQQRLRIYTLNLKRIVFNMHTVLGTLPSIFKARSWHTYKDSRSVH